MRSFLGFRRNQTSAKPLQPSTRAAPFLLLIGTALAFGALVLQGGAGAADSGPVGGIGVTRFGSTYAGGTGYERYAYVAAGVGDAAAAGSLPTTSLVYMSGTSIQTSWLTGVPYQEALANNWLLKDASGQYLRNVTFGAYVGDIGNAAYQQRFVDNVASFLSQNGNEGVFIDDVLVTPVGMTGGVFPAKYPTQRAWEDAMVSFVANAGSALKARGFYVVVNASAYIGGNEASDTGGLTAAFWQRLAPHVGGLMSEYWEQLPNDTSQVRASGTSAWTQHWDGWLDLVNVAQNGGADFFGLMEGSSASVHLMRYGKASFLLAWDGSGGAFVYHPEGDPWNPEWTMDIGQPSGPKYQVGVGWRRDYSGGTVVLNPSPSSSQAFSLGATYTQPNGTAVSSVTLGPTSALILGSQSSSPPPPPPPPPPSSPASGTTYVSDLSWSSASNGWGPVEKDRSNGEQGTGDGRTLTLNGTAYQKGLGVHAASDVRYALGGACSRFQANVGVDDEVGANGSAVFEVYADTTKIYDSGAMAGASATKTVDVSVAGANQLRLVVANGGDDINFDHADWALARVECGSSSSPPPPSAPVNTALPAISGTPQEGLVLSASTGTWSNSPTGYAYAWKRCDSSGGACTSIAGATSAQYTLVSADVGNTLRVTVTASNTGGSASATSNASAIVAGAVAPPPPPSAPVNTALPAISGTPQEGLVLSASTGTWSNSPTGYAYAWKRCDSSGGACTSIAGATSAQYTLVSADVGNTLRVTVTASNTGGSASATSNATANIAAAPAPPPPPSPSPTPTDTSYLSDLAWTEMTNGWGPVEKDTSNGEAAAGDGVTLALNGTTYPKGLGAHAPSDVRYALGGDCSRFQAEVGGDDETNLWGTVVFEVYADTTKVYDSGVMTGTSATQQVDVSIAGASELRLVVANGGDDINFDHADWALARVECGSSSTSPSPAPLPPPPPPPSPPVNTQLPTISGTAQEGLNLSASTGAWSNSPTGYAYQWRRCDSAGGACTSIAGAAGAQYTLGVADVAHTLRVEVTATNVGGSTAATSDPSTVVAPAPAPLPPPPPSPSPPPPPPSPSAPVNTQLPTISGTPQEGLVLSASTGTWSNSPTGYAYEWKRCDSSSGACDPIAGATSAQYTLASADVGKTPRVTVTASNGGGSASATSVASAAVAPRPAPLPPPKNVTPPSVSGTMHEGRTVRTSDGSWTNNPARFTYEWRRCDSSRSDCRTIEGARSSTYDITRDDVGFEIVAIITAWNASGSSSAASNRSSEARAQHGAGTDKP